MNYKIKNWITKKRLLSKITKSEPPACFVSGYELKLTFYLRTILEISQLLQRLDHLVSKEFIASITDGIP